MSFHQCKKGKRDWIQNQELQKSLEMHEADLKFLEEKLTYMGIEYSKDQLSLDKSEREKDLKDDGQVLYYYPKKSGDWVRGGQNGCLSNYGTWVQ